MSQPDNRRLRTPRDIAEQIGVCRVTFDRWCKTGRGPRALNMPGRLKKFLASDVDEWLLTMAKGQ